MATLEKRGDGYRLIFYFRNKRFTRSIKTNKASKAEDLRRRLQGNLELLEQGRLEYVPGKDDLPTLLLSDGKLNSRPEPVKSVMLGDFFERYQGARPPGKEKNTENTEDIHIAHLLRLLGKRTFLAEVPDKLQAYITARSAEHNRRGDSISQATIKKELGTLMSVWNKWGMSKSIRLVSVRLTLLELEYPKEKQKPPFQTWEQIERRIARGKLTPYEQGELWDALFLTVAQIEELLRFVKSNGSLVRKSRKHFPWVYPMFAYCAYTGARRIEMLRSRVEDFDFEVGEVTIREKKKDHTKEETLRHVPMAAALRVAMEDWLRVHPGGPIMFCIEPGEKLTEAMATHYLRWTLDEGKWKVIKGWHCLRHSFISNLASKGTPEAVIMKLAGHLNADTTRRYSHLIPSSLQDALRTVFD